MAPRPSAWIFQANPERWDIDGALAEEPLTLRWLVNQHEKDIEPLDRAYLWKAGGGGGIVAIATVISHPRPMEGDELTRRYAIDVDKFTGRSTRVQLRLERILDTSLRRTDLLAHPKLSSMAVLIRPQGTNFPLTAAEDETLSRLVGLR